MNIKSANGADAQVLCGGLRKEQPEDYREVENLTPGFASNYNG